jgi:hypothetical protein
VGKWRGRFARRRLEGLIDKSRPGAPKTITDDDVEQVVVTTLEETPRDATHWWTRSLAKQTGMSKSTVARIWRAFGLKPHLVDTFKLSTDPRFKKVRDLVSLFLNPPEAAVVLCVDEKTQAQAVDRTQPVLPLLPGAPQRRTHDYTRHGTTNLYARAEPGLWPGHRQRLDPPDAGDPTLAGCPSLLPCAPHADLQLVVEPGGALVFGADDQVAAAWLAPQRCGARAVDSSVGRDVERGSRPFVWHKTADEILESLAAYCQRIPGTGHQ